MKSLKNMNSSRRSKKKTDEEKRTLIQGNNNDTGKYTETPMSNSRSRNSSQSSLPRSPRVTRRTQSSSSHENADVPMISIRPDSNLTPPSSPKVSAAMELNFDKVPFQFYTRSNTSWASSILQSIVIVISCILLPCLIVALIMWINKKRLRYKGRVKKEEKEQQGNYLLSLFLITLLKDSMILALILDNIYKTPVSKYELAYAPFVFVWTLICFIMPLAAFIIGDTNYNFGFDSDKKKLLEIFAQISSMKVKEEEIKKLNDQEKYFTKNYKLLSELKSCGDEIKFLKESTRRPTIITAIFIIIMTCIVHALLPMILQIAECLFCRTESVIIWKNETYFDTTVNKTVVSLANKTLIDDKPYGIYYAVLGLSTLNSFAVSMFASLYFVYVTLWKISLLSEWKRFNENERDSTDTLINSGPQGIAMWWKIRQTLKLFSTSSLSMSVVIGKIQCVVNFVCIAALSIALILSTKNRDGGIRLHALLPLLVDTILLYIALLIIGCLSIFIDREQAVSSHLIQLKQLNICYELGRYMNMEQESMDREPGIRIKVRVMRGCSVLLQELTSAMDKLEKSASSHLNVACFILATVLMIPTIIMTFKYISNIV